MLAIAVPRKEPEKWNSISEEKIALGKVAHEKLERGMQKQEYPVTKIVPVVEKKNRQGYSPASKINLRYLGLGGIILFTLICGALGLNYILNNLIGGGTPTIPILPTYIPPINPIVGSTWTQTIDGMILLYVPAGEFTMGSNDNLDQQPIHQVDLNAFWIDQTEVTNKMYGKCVDAGKCDLPNFPLHYYDSSYGNHPVVFVSWNDAFAYCFWANRRLPTEAEWEKAARGTESFIYPWGNESPNSTLLNYNRNVGSTTEVGKYPDGVSVYGALDMAGNVWEWVSSLHKPYPYDASDGRENMDSLEDRVHRGGSWNLSGGSSTYRSSGSPTFSVNVIGFRCARSP
jgi:formylglycine-generating enzyme required for sulfatase activity